MACHEQGDNEPGAPDFLRQLLVNADPSLQLIEQSGASVTNKGIYYETGKEPPSEGPPKLHLLIESNDEYRVSANILLMPCACSYHLPHRSNMLFGKSNDYCLKHLQRRSKPKAADLRQLVDTAFCNTGEYRVSGVVAAA